MHCKSCCSRTDNGAGKPDGFGINREDLPHNPVNMRVAETSSRERGKQEGKREK